MPKKLTKRQVESTRSTERDIFLWDGILPGFGVRLRPSGRRSFVVQYRTREGASRRRVLGTFPTMTVEEARREARGWLTSAQKGQDPALTRDLARRASTVEDLCDRFLKDHAERHKKPRSAAEDRRLIEKIIQPRLGSRKAAAVSEQDVADLHKSLNATPYSANRVRALLSAVFNQAEAELRSVKPAWVNPCRKVKPYRELARRRYLAPAELGALGNALAAAEVEGIAEPESIAAIRLLIFTGARRWEILSLPWSQVDLEARRLRLADSKTGAKDVHLNPPAIEVLRQIRRVPGNPYVLPGGRPGTHIQDLKRAWGRVRDRAGLELALAQTAANGSAAMTTAALRFMAVLGWSARKVRALTWGQIDLQSRRLFRGDDHVALLPPDLAAVLADLPKGPAESEIFADLDLTSKGLQRAFEELSEHEGLRDVRLHDLRHSVASVGGRGPACRFLSLAPCLDTAPRRQRSAMPTWPPIPCRRPWTWWAGAWPRRSTVVAMMGVTWGGKEAARWCR